MYHLPFRESRLTRSGQDRGAAWHGIPSTATRCSPLGRRSRRTSRSTTRSRMRRSSMRRQVCWARRHGIRRDWPRAWTTTKAPTAQSRWPTSSRPASEFCTPITCTSRVRFQCLCGLRNPHSAVAERAPSARAEAARPPRRAPPARSRSRNRRSLPRRRRARLALQVLVPQHLHARTLRGLLLPAPVLLPNPLLRAQAHLDAARRDGAHESLPPAGLGDRGRTDEDQCAPRPRVRPPAAARTHSARPLENMTCWEFWCIPPFGSIPVLAGLLTLCQTGRRAGVHLPERALGSVSDSASRRGAGAEADPRRCTWPVFVCCCPLWCAIATKYNSIT